MDNTANPLPNETSFDYSNDSRAPSTGSMCRSRIVVPGEKLILSPSLCGRSPDAGTQMATPPLPVVQIDKVTKTYGNHTAVSDLSLAVPPGSLYGFIGPNGSGKTTTIRMILRIIYPDIGRIDVLGNGDASAANDRVVYLPEERGLYKKLTVRRMLVYYASLKGMSRPDATQQIAAWLERFGLMDWANKKIETLSKGMSQKVQFIASVISRPDLLILDEPFSGLDPVNTEIIRSSILELQRQGTTIIFSTHDMAVAEKMCDFIFMIYQGNKVLDGTLADIKAQYGADSIRLRWDGTTDILQTIPEIERIGDMGGFQEVQVSGDPQRVLHTLVQKGRVDLFEITQPSLHDIFMRIAGAPMEAAEQELPGAAEQDLSGAAS
jgi:ABC-2 type transport system ATP-binding protein